MKIVHTVLAAALLLTALPVAAQDAGATGAAPCQRGQHGQHAFDPARFAQHWQERAQRLSQRLGLDARQQQALNGIVQAELQRFQQTVASLPAHTPERHAARRALMDDFDSRFSAILSPVQRGQWQGIKDEMHARAEQRHAAHANGEHDWRGGHHGFHGDEGPF